MNLTVWDPGMSTGVVEAEVLPDQPVRILDAWQTHDGVEGVIQILCNYFESNNPHPWVVEKFRVGPRTYKAAELEPLRIEGALMLFNPEIVFQYNDKLLLAGAENGGTSQAQRRSKNKIAADNVLREMGLWRTGKMIDDKDANDVNSAMKHLVAYLRDNNHQPTLDALEAILT